MHLTKYLGAAFLVLIVGLGFYAFSQRQPYAPAGDGDSATLRVGQNAVYVADQIPGDTILVSVAALARAGFVVIHSDAAGAPGEILGTSALLPAGENKDVRINLTGQAVQDGAVLYAMIHLDNGDGQFDASQDQPAIDPLLQEPVFMVFNIDSAAAPIGPVTL